jgi:hypothetical protein
MSNYSGKSAVLCWAIGKQWANGRVRADNRQIVSLCYIRKNFQVPGTCYGRTGNTTSITSSALKQSRQRGGKQRLDLGNARLGRTRGVHVM